MRQVEVHCLACAESDDVQRHLGAIVRAFAPELVLIRGLAPMVGEVESPAVELGVPQDAIRTEAYDR